MGKLQQKLVIYAVVTVEQFLDVFLQNFWYFFLFMENILGGQSEIVVMMGMMKLSLRCCVSELYHDWIVI